MITTTDAPPWLRRSDQAVTWAWTCSHPTTPSSSTARPTDLPGTVRARSPIRTCRIRTRTEWGSARQKRVSKETLGRRPDRRAVDERPDWEPAAGLYVPDDGPRNDVWGPGALRGTAVSVVRGRRPSRPRRRHRI